MAIFVVSLSMSAQASDNQGDGKGWSLTLGEGTPIVQNPTFVSDAPGAIPPVETAAASTGSPSVEDVGDGTTAHEGDNSLGGGSLPSVPLPAPVLIAGIGVAGLILCRNKIGKLVR